jgi:cell division septation protein DedD/nucleoid DNA-binding protein
MVARYIKELLQESDEVIVQDLGTFHTSYCSAEIHPVSHAFAAPNKNISFQTKIKTSNFLLENYIAQKENISFEEAKEEIQKFVSTLKVNLGVEKRFALEDLGEFVLQVTDEIEFKQNKQANILKDSFGLPEIYAKPIERNGATQKSVVSNTNQTKKASTPNQKVPTEEPRSTWGTVAAIGSLAFVVLAVVYVVAVDSSLNPFNALLGRKSEKKENKKQEEKILVQTETKQETQNAMEENNVSKPEENNQQVTDTEPNKSEETAQKLQEETTQKPQEAQDKVVEEKKVEEKTNKTQGDGILLENKTNQFYIVIGGFASQNNAYKKVREAKAKGVENVKIVPPFDAKNLYRVAVGAFATREQAEANLEEIKNTFNVEAWVLKY